MKPTLSLIAMLLLAPQTGTFAADFHVDAQRGGDLHPGTQAEPLGTISKAPALVQPGLIANLKITPAK